MTQIEKEKCIKKNSILGVIFGTIFGALLGYLGGAALPVYTDEEWEEVQKQNKIREQKCLEKQTKIKELENQKLEIDKQINELNGKSVTGYTYS